MYEDFYLIHHGIKGMRWGVRRYQNDDGTLTEAGKIRYMKKAEQLKASYDKAKHKSLKADKKYHRYMRRYAGFRTEYFSDRLGKKAIKRADKANRKLEKASTWFQHEMKSLSKMGLNEDQIQYLSQLGEELLTRKEFYDALRHERLEYKGAR